MDNKRYYDDAIGGLSVDLKKVLFNVKDEIKSRCSEVRLRTGKPVTVVCGGEKFILDVNGNASEAENGFICSKEMMKDSFLRICDFSVHTHSQELSKGYVTVKGGHRVGISGTAVLDENDKVLTVRDVTSMCIRVAKDVIGCASDICHQLMSTGFDSVILAGPPSSGKTTLLRDLVRVLSECGNSVSVVDERQEISSFYKGICNNDLGINTDVYFGYPKVCAINMALRTMSPDVIAVDEICEEDEVKAIVSAANCGVKLIATLHAADLNDLVSKHQSLSLLRTGVFRKVVLLNCEKGEYRKRVFGVEEINDEIYRSRLAMDELSVNWY